MVNSVIILLLNGSGSSLDGDGLSLRILNSPDLLGGILVQG